MQDRKWYLSIFLFNIFVISFSLSQDIFISFCLSLLISLYIWMYRISHPSLSLSLSLLMVIFIINSLSLSLSLDILWPNKLYLKKSNCWVDCIGVGRGGPGGGGGGVRQPPNNSGGGQHTL